MGVWDGIEVLDLSWGVSGPLAGMLLADQGARVTKIEPPGGDPSRRLSGSRVWNRGKRSAVLDLKQPGDRETFLALSRGADVVISSFAPGVANRLGVDYDTLSAANPRLIYCSITGYGEDSPDSDRPGIDGLVAARTGHQWEVRGVSGGMLSRLAGTEGMVPGLDRPEGCWVGPDRDGPLFSGVPWVSLATFYIATTGIVAALRARELTGRGQRVSASLLQGVMATTIAPWQKVERPDSPYFQTWVIDPRAPKGFFKASDDRWTHHWVPLPEFVLGAVESGMSDDAGLVGPKQASLRVSTMPEDMIVLHAYQDQLAEAVARYPSEEWVQLAGKVGVPVQPVRSPEEALLDPLLLADGCVVEVDDPEMGAIRQVGRVIELSEHPASPPSAAPLVGQHTSDVKAEAGRISAVVSASPSQTLRQISSPLEGVTVLDLGLAVAGPFGTQLLAQLGAKVIKVNTTRDKFWFSNHIAMSCNRDKDSIILNLKDPQAAAVLHRLVEQADVVQHNMRYDAAERLGVDYESLRRVNPALIYCHTLGHEQGPREQHPGNDQTGAALAGIEWLDGGLDNGGRPVWSCTSLGDTGNGFLSAIGIIEALYDRDRTGNGQFVRTSILYAHLLNASMAWTTVDGKSGDRQRPDADLYGWNSLYRLYETTDGWICVAVFGDDAWRKLCGAIERADLAGDERFASEADRVTHDDALAGELEAVFRQRAAADWFRVLDDAEVPCEISDPDYALRLFDDPKAVERGQIAEFQHRIVGNMKMAGLYFDLSDTPGRIWGPPAWPGANSRQILEGAGYAAEEIAALIASGIVEDTSDTPAVA